MERKAMRMQFRNFVDGFLNRGSTGQSSRFFLLPVLLLCFALLVGFAAQGRVSGRFSLELVARPIPPTLARDIGLGTPGEFATLQFAVSSNLDLTASFGFACLNINTVVNMAGPEYLVIKTPINSESASLREIGVDSLRVVPKMWFAVPFETVTDVNNLPNSVVIPPGDTLPVAALFVTGRVTSSVSVAGFSIRYLAMMADINFPRPGASYEPLFYSAEDQNFAVGSLIFASWRAPTGIFASANIGINASSAGTSIKGHSAAGSVLPDNFFARFSVSGIDLGVIQLYETSVQSIRLGTSFSITRPPTGDESTAFNTTISLSGELWDGASISGSIALAPFPPKLTGLTVSLDIAPLRFVIALDTMELKSITFRFRTGLDIGAMTGSFGVTASGLERVTGLSMRLSLSQGIFSAATNVSFAERAERFGFASLGSTLALRIGPAIVSVRMTFGRHGLTRASVTAGVVF